MSGEDQMEGFKPRNSLGRSPPGGFHSRDFLPSSKAAVDKPSPVLTEKPKGNSDSRKKKRSPEVLASTAKTSAERGKRAKITKNLIYTDSSSDSEEEVSRHEESEGSEGANLDLTLYDDSSIDKTLEEFGNFINGLLQKRKTITDPTAKQALDYIMIIKKETQKNLLKYPNLKGRYEESKRVNRELMDMREVHKKIVRTHRK